MSRRLEPYASFVWRDESASTVTGRLSCSQVEASTALDAAALVAAASEGCSDCVVDRISITYPKDDPNPRQALPGVLNSNGALFVFETSVDDQLFALNLPGVPATLFDNTKDPPGFHINTSNTAVIALVNLLVNGIWVNPFGHSLTGLISAYRIVQ